MSKYTYFLNILVINKSSKIVFSINSNCRYRLKLSNMQNFRWKRIQRWEFSKYAKRAVHLEISKKFHRVSRTLQLGGKDVQKSTTNAQQLNTRDGKLEYGIRKFENPGAAERPLTGNMTTIHVSHFGITCQNFEALQKNFFHFV